MKLNTLWNHIRLVIAVLSLSTQLLKAQLTKKYENYEALSYKGLSYGLFKPVNYEAGNSYPLILYLHGYTDTVSWNLNWYGEAFQSENPCFVLTPKSHGSPHDGTGWGSSWIDTLSIDLKKTMEILDALIDNYSINTNRLYIYGASMGGHGVYSLLSKEPGMFAAAYITCGAGNLELAENIMQTPLWIFHGELDNIVPVSHSRDMYQKILSLGSKNVRYTEYPGIKHNSWENVAQEQTLAKWFFAQEKCIEHESSEKVKGFTIGSYKNEIVALKWDQPSNSTNPDKEVWYYKLFRNDTLIAEIDGGAGTYSDSDFTTDNTNNYHIVAVNYFFKESEPSETVKIE